MKILHLISLLALGLLLSACGPSSTLEPTADVAAVRTSAASTVESRFTLTAAAFTPTLPPPLATDTPASQVEETATLTPETVAEAGETATEIPCDLMSYDPLTVDVNVPDNTIMSPGQEFVKTWKVKNTGSCAWGAGYVLAFTKIGDEMDGQFIALTEVVQPGDEVDVSVQFKAPAEAGVYVSTWTMRNPQGFTFPEAVYVKIVVQ